MPKYKYTVCVMRVVKEYQTVEVEAEDMEDAKLTALEKLDNNDLNNWKYYDTIKNPHVTDVTSR